MYRGFDDGGYDVNDCVKVYHDLGLDTESVFKGKLKGTDNVISKLDSVLWYLPSDLSLPYAEQQWALKEYRQEIGEDHLGHLNRCLRAIDKEIARCRNNLGIIRNNGGRLSAYRRLVREGYDDAISKQNWQLVVVSEQRQKLIEAIRRLEVALNKLRAKKYPGKGKPPVKIVGGAPWGGVEVPAASLPAETGARSTPQVPGTNPGAIKLL